MHQGECRSFTEVHSNEMQPWISEMLRDASSKGPVSSQDVGTSSNLQVVQQEVEELLTANGILKE